MAAGDPIGAFVPHDAVKIDGAAAGPLSGLRFAAKDLFDVAGHRTGAGNPRWLATHAPATATAPAITTLLAAGASLTGKTHTDELAYSLNGENAHYGTPVNPACPERIPGGSSSGSASATAARLVDFALGTDTGGSIRVPASYCGLFGLRPTHGAVAAEGVVPLAPSFDTVGWFARSAELLRRAGEVLLPPAVEAPVTRVLFARDAFAVAGGKVTAALALPIDAVRDAFDATDGDVAGVDELSRWSQIFRLTQAGEIARVHGGWAAQNADAFGPGVGERFAWALSLPAETVAEASAAHAAIRERLRELVRPGTVVCLPTVPGAAPLRNTPPAALEDWRARTMSLTAIAGLGGLPQVSLPLGIIDGCPLGLSLIGAAGCDRDLLAAAERLIRRVDEA